jgi:DNA-directed RNA polymerase alpha subunit
MNQKTSPIPHPGHPKRGPAELETIRSAVPTSFDYKRLSYRRRFCDRVVESPIIGGVDYPEELLKMSKAEIFRIAGIGKVSLSEIEQYRQKFLLT